MEARERFSTVGADLKKIDFAILAALEVERKAVCEAFGLTHEHRVRQGSRVYWRGSLPLKGDEAYEIVVAQAPDAANVDSAILTNDLLHHWQPGSALLVGIAASTEPGKVRLGDVVAGSEVYYYERVKETPEGRKIEPKIIIADATLWSNIIAMPDWDGKVAIERPDGSGLRSRLHRGVIASGEKVIADIAVRDEIASKHRKILALEMEGYGFSRAVWQSFEHVRHLDIRAVSDDGTPAKDDRWHAYAAAAAAAFAKYYLLDRPVEPSNAPSKVIAPAPASRASSPAPLRTTSASDAHTLSLPCGPNARIRIAPVAGLSAWRAASAGIHLEHDILSTWLGCYTYQEWMPGLAWGREVRIVNEGGRYVAYVSVSGYQAWTTLVCSVRASGDSRIELRFERNGPEGFPDESLKRGQMVLALERGDDGAVEFIWAEMQPGIPTLASYVGQPSDRFLGHRDIAERLRRLLGLDYQRLDDCDQLVSDIVRKGRYLILGGSAHPQYADRAYRVLYDVRCNKIHVFVHDETLGQVDVWSEDWGSLSPLLDMMIEAMTAKSKLPIREHR